MLKTSNVNYTTPTQNVGVVFSNQGAKNMEDQIINVVSVVINAIFVVINFFKARKK